MCVAGSGMEGLWGAVGTVRTRVQETCSTVGFVINMSPGGTVFLFLSLISSFTQ